ncbi:MAG: type II toxin-antitoxin system HicB family antitoxin [Isosphaeraceae bacterium]
MKYKVCLHQSEEGFDVWVPGLPGCCSQGVTEENALANIAGAIREYLAAIAEPIDGVHFREVEVVG